MCSLCRLLVAKNHNFGQILTFWKLLYQPPFTDEGQIWCRIADTWCTFTCEISSGSVCSVVLWLRKTQIFTAFGPAFSGVANGSSLRKLNMRTQLQTFPYPMVSKSFLCSHAFMMKSGAQSLTFKSVTNRQTDKQKTQRFWLRRRRVKSKPNQT